MANNSANTEKKGLGRKFKELVAELKKVIWPKFIDVLKATLVVLFVTVIFLLVMFAFDLLLGWLYGLLTGANVGTVVMGAVGSLI